MFLKHQAKGTMIEILDVAQLADPSQGAVEGRIHAGEEMQDSEEFAKAELIFPSGEALPQCWRDAQYRA